MPVRIKYTKDILEPVVKQCFSWRALIDYFGKKPTGGNYNAFQLRVKKFNLDINHFVKNGWAKGKTAATDPIVASTRNKNAKLLARLKAGTVKEFIHGHSLKRFLLDSNRPYQCDGIDCGITTWKNKPISLDVDHINGDNTDQRLENLRFLCPNCHRQTPTWGSKNRMKTTGVAPVPSKGLASKANESACSSMSPKILKKQCKNCDAFIYKSSVCCRKCHLHKLSNVPRKTKIIWPSKEEITKALEVKSVLALSRELGVSDNAIRKYLNR